jgi:osmotically-inducible protein OsmY
MAVLKFTRGNSNMTYNNRLAGLTLAVSLLSASISLPALADQTAFGISAGSLSKKIERDQQKGKLSMEEAKEFADKESQVVGKADKLVQEHKKLTADERKSLLRDLQDLRKEIVKVETAKANNTIKNVGDGRIDSPNPQVASNKKSDLRIAQKLRKSLLADKSLSDDAKNVKIITINGTVTLRGPVDSAAEKDKLNSLAGQCVGSDRVLNEIDVVVPASETGSKK